MDGDYIIQQVSYDVRQVIGTTGTPESILMNYVDRVQREMLHTTFWASLIRNVTTVTTAPGTPSYTISASPAVRRVLLVYDRARDRILLPFEVITVPAAEMAEPGTEKLTAQQAETVVGPLELKRLKTQSAQAEYYRFASGVVYFFPTPQQVQTIELHYNAQVPIVTDPTATLTLPDDTLDAVVAGVNMYANLFLARMEDAKFWAQLYQQLKKGEDFK
jgi:hypothetical protein